MGCTPLHREWRAWFSTISSLSSNHVDGSQSTFWNTTVVFLQVTWRSKIATTYSGEVPLKLNTKAKVPPFTILWITFCSGIFYKFSFFHVPDIRFWNSLESPQWGGCSMYLKSMFWANRRKIIYAPAIPCFPM